jgi:hypothetical protein
MGRRGQQDNAWALGELDLPHLRAIRKEPGELGKLQHNPVLWWLLMARRRRVLPKFFDINPLVVILLGPALALAMLHLLWGSAPTLFHLMAACFVIGVGLVAWKSVFNLAAARRRRGVLMHLPQLVLNDLRLTRMSPGNIFSGVWGFEARARRYRIARIAMAALSLALLPLSVTIAGPVAFPLLAWAVARMVVLKDAYPYQALARMHRVLRRQASDVKGAMNLKSALADMGHTAFKPIGAGLVFLLFYVLPVTVWVTTKDPPEVPWYVPEYCLGTVAALVAGFVMGTFWTTELQNSHGENIKECKRFVMTILRHHGYPTPPNISRHPMWDEVH